MVWMSQLNSNSLRSQTAIRKYIETHPPKDGAAKDDRDCCHQVSCDLALHVLRMYADQLPKQTLEVIVKVLNSSANLRMKPTKTNNNDRVNDNELIAKLEGGRDELSYDARRRLETVKSVSADLLMLARGETQD